MICKKAVFRIKGPLLILAGAGSGKTTVLVNRISNLLKYGDAYNTEKSSRTPDEYDVELMQRYLAGDSSVYHEIRDVLSYDAPMPWQILAITFTNKAANELKERLVKMLGIMLRYLGMHVSFCLFAYSEKKRRQTRFLISFYNL